VASGEWQVANAASANGIFVALSQLARILICLLNNRLFISAILELTVFYVSHKAGVSSQDATLVSRQEFCLARGW